LDHYFWVPGDGDGDVGNPGIWLRYDPLILPILTSKYIYDAVGVNGVLANVFLSVLVIAAILNTPIVVSTRCYLFPGTFGSDGIPFSGIKQFGRPAVTPYSSVIVVLTGRSKDNQLVLVGNYKQ
jgi:hypothetical protein